jgi:hypothetical protein
MRGKGRIGGKARSDVSSGNDTPPPSSSKSGESNVSKTATFFLCVAAIYASYISQGLLQENMSVVLPPLYYAVLKLLEIFSIIFLLSAIGCLYHRSTQI